MATKRLADVRQITMAEAEYVHEQMFRKTVTIMRAEQEAEAKIAEINAKLESDIAADKAAVEEMETRLATFIMSNHDQFKRPRMHVTRWGSFGLRKTTRVKVFDEAALIAYSQNRPDMLLTETVEKISKGNVSKHLRDGIDIQGAMLDVGENVDCKFDPKAIREEL